MAPLLYYYSFNLTKSELFFSSYMTISQQPNILQCNVYFRADFCNQGEKINETLSMETISDFSNVKCSPFFLGSLVVILNIPSKSLF